MKASADGYLHFWVFFGLNPFLQEMIHTSWYFSEPASKHFSSSKLYHNLKLWVHVFHHLWNFLHVFYCQKEFNGNLDGKDFPPQKFWWHFSKVKKYNLVIFLKDRFWPTKIELEAYSSTFLHHGMDYLNSMREAMRALFNSSAACIQAIPGSGSWVVWAVNPPDSFHIHHFSRISGNRRS